MGGRQRQWGGRRSRIFATPTRGRQRLTRLLPALPTTSSSAASGDEGVWYRLACTAGPTATTLYNDSVFVQFAGSVNSSGGAVHRIGTTAATQVLPIEPRACSGCGLTGWKWQDNGWGTARVAEPIYFATTGTQRMRVQTREDGMSIDGWHPSPSN